jgi:hypothetical protein
MEQTYEGDFTYTADNGDIVREFYRITYTDNNTKNECVNRCINNRFVSATYTTYVNGYKHGHQTILKDIGNGNTQRFVEYYDNGVLEII